MTQSDISPAGPVAESGRPFPPVAVIGAGYWGKNLARNFHALGVLKAVCDSNDTVLEERRAQYPGVETTGDPAAILGRDDVDAVAIASPAVTHYDLAREALAAGKHVFVEKPFVLDESQGEELIGVARRSGLVIMVGHVLRYHPAFIRLKELAAAGELGTLHYIYSNRLSFGKFRREENILWSFAPHDISMILALAGGLPESVLATGGSYLHERIADVTTTHLMFPSGLRAHIHVSWLHPFKEQKLVVIGDKRMAVFDDTRPWGEKLALYTYKVDWNGDIPDASKADVDYLAVPEQEPLREECLHFLESVAEGTTPVTDGHEGLDVLRVLNLSQRSLDEGGRRHQFG